MKKFTKANLVLLVNALLDQEDDDQITLNCDDAINTMHNLRKATGRPKFYVHVNRCDLRIVIRIPKEELPKDCLNFTEKDIKEIQIGPPDDTPWCWSREEEDMIVDSVEYVECG